MRRHAAPLLCALAFIAGVVVHNATAQQGPNINIIPKGLKLLSPSPLGTYGSAASTLTGLAIDGYGRVTALTSTSIAVTQSQVTNLATDLSTLTTNVASKAAKGANSDITSLSGLSTPLSIAQGGTAGTSAATARSALSAASSGANSDITSLTSLSTPLSIAQGGTAGTTAATARTALGFKTATCTLDGTATPTCTVTNVTALSICTCTYASATLPHIVACSLATTTVTVISATTLDSGVVNVTCIAP